MSRRGLVAAAFTVVWAIGALAAEMDPSLLKLLPESQRQQLLDAVGGTQKPEETGPPTVKLPAQPIYVQPPLLPVDELRPFGYDLFTSIPTTFAPATDIPVPKDYVLGPGDAINVQFFGTENTTHRLIVSREGRIVLPKLGPIDVAGLKFDDFQAALERRVETQMIGVKVGVSMGPLRSIRIFVLGDANYPGSYTVSGLSTITNALFVSGGVKTLGSLRNIQLKRNGQVVQRLDLYDLLLHGDSSRDSRLSPGDVVFIPPVGPRVGVTGEVKRPALYELRGEKSVTEALELAGGTMATTDTSMAQIERVADRSKRVLLTLNLTEAKERAIAVQDGDILHVRAIPERIVDAVNVLGFVERPGTYALQPGMRVGQLVSLAQGVQSGADKQAYLLVGLIERTDLQTGLRTLQHFDLHDILTNQDEGPELKPDDKLLIFGRQDVGYLSSDAVQAVLQGREPKAVRPEPEAPDAKAGALPTKIAKDVAPFRLTADPNGQYLEQIPGATYPGAAAAGAASRQPRGAAGAPPVASAGAAPVPPELVARKPAERCLGLQRLAEIVNTQRSLRFSLALTAQGVRANIYQRPVMRCPEIFEEVPEALPYLLEQSIALNGEVRFPGLYPVGPSVSLPLVIQAAGGLSNEGDASNVEYIPNERGISAAPAQRNIDVRTDVAVGTQVQPGDVLNFRPVYGRQEPGTVLLAGEFRFPGTYTISRGERLSQLIERAGGLTENAYPYGAVFTRDSARKTEEAGFRRAASDLQEAMATAVTSGVLGNSAGQAAELLAALIKRLESTPPVGRVVAELDPAVLRVKPELDLGVEPGDAVYMPKRAATVTVTGQVLNPGSVAFKSGADARDYINLAGGLGTSADDDRVFVVFPNGAAQTLNVSYWSFTSQQVPPGSTIVVPRDAAPLNSIVLTERLSQIFSNLAIAAAALVTINR
jgi:polysaccharide biosynthesis/export protein